MAFTYFQFHCPRLGTDFSGGWHLRCQPPDVAATAVA
jgi:hypothetical protein